MSLTREEFIRKIKDDVMKDAKISKILPSLTIAQAILESNNGNSGLAVKGKALFGIKANSSWKGKVYVSDTKEVYSGVQYIVKASFRAYNNWAESIADHTKLLISLKRYSNIIGEKNYVQACKKIQQDGYATDPYYASKLINIIESNQLFNYDDYEEEEPPVKSKSQKVTPIRQSGRKQGSGMEVCVIKPTSIEDAREITETLLANRTVVLNLEGLDVDIAQRIIDFTSGSCFAISGNLQKISHYIFIITPAIVDISGDFQEILSGSFDVPINNGI